MNYVAEVSPVTASLPSNARMFVLINADNDLKAIDAIQALGIIRHDRPVQIDLHERIAGTIGRKVWSGLHRPPVLRPRLSVVA